MAKKSILFVCCGNTCRSVFAEYLARNQYSDRIEVESVGISPGKPADAENAIFTLSQYKIDASQHEPRNIGEVDLNEFDIVVALDQHIARSLGARIDPARLIAWEVEDPFGYDLDEYHRCATHVSRSLRQLVNSLEDWERA